MRQSPRLGRTAAFVLTLVAFAVLVTGCGSSSSKSSSSTSATTNAAATTSTPAAQLAVADKGTLSIGADISFAPWETPGPGGSPVGIDPEFAKALGKSLGVGLKWTNTKFDSLVPGLTAHRYDVIISALSDRKARRGAGVNFIDYAGPYATFLVRKGNPHNVHRMTDLCGLYVVGTTGATSLQQVADQSKKCKAAGKAPVKIQGFGASGDQTQALKAGRGDVWFEDIVSHTAALKALGNSGFDIVRAEGVPRPYYGVGVPKTNRQLLTQMQAAIQKAMDEGVLTAAAKKFGLPPDIFLTKAVINQGPG